MNREIKFRAWDGSTMINNIGIHPSISMAHEGYKQGEDGWLTVSPAMLSYNIMQFTGLVDKNGKWIYEGDIVKSNNTVINSIEFKNGMFVWGDLTLCYDDEILDEDHLTLPSVWAEVIGNIYENKDIL